MLKEWSLIATDEAKLEEVIDSFFANAKKNNELKYEIEEDDENGQRRRKWHCTKRCTLAVAELRFDKSH